MNNKIINDLKSKGMQIFKAGLDAVDPVTAVKSAVKLSGSILKISDKEYDLDSYHNVVVIGAGKAGSAMSRAIEEILGDRISFGHVNVKYGHLDKVKKIKIHEAGHPVPDEAGYEGAKIISDILETVGEKDLVIFLLSGGGSALLPLPIRTISLIEKQQTTNLLLSCGATINEINAIRKHISRFKGGWLAKRAFPAQLVTLIISDVIGDPLDTIASGPTVGDNSTFEECSNIITKYKIGSEIPRGVANHIYRGLTGEVKETPKPDEAIFQKVQNVIVANNMKAFNASKEKAIELGFQPLILSTLIEGETREIAKMHAGIAKEIQRSGNPIIPPACILSGGETTVTIYGNGLGGRNQEFALASAIEIDGMENIAIFSIATDGTDGPTDHAGAIADGTTLQRASALNMNADDFLNDNDAYHFFNKLDDLITTGPTNTNVMDVRIMLVL